MDGSRNGGSPLDWEAKIVESLQQHGSPGAFRRALARVARDPDVFEYVKSRLESWRSNRDG